MGCGASNSATVAPSGEAANGQGNGGSNGNEKSKTSTTATDQQGKNAGGGGGESAAGNTANNNNNTSVEAISPSMPGPPSPFMENANKNGSSNNNNTNPNGGSSSGAGGASGGGGGGIDNDRSPSRNGGALSSSSTPSSLNILNNNNSKDDEDDEDLLIFGVGGGATSEKKTSPSHLAAATTTAAAAAANAGKTGPPTAGALPKDIFDDPLLSEDEEEQDEKEKEKTKNKNITMNGNKNKNNLKIDSELEHLDQEELLERLETMWNVSSLPPTAVKSTASLSHIGATSPFTGQPLKSENQDVVSCYQSFEGGGKYSVMCVFDGHGTDGLTMANLCQDAMIRKLRMMKVDGVYPPNALSSAFLAVQRELALAPHDAKFSGCTASVAVITGQTLFFAKVGDSRAILVSELLTSLSSARSRGSVNSINNNSNNIKSNNSIGGGGMFKAPAIGMAVVRDLGLDHRPEIGNEKQRIEMAGGRVVVKVDDRGHPIGPARVYHSVEPFPGLMLSRSLGDTYAHQIGVSHIPEITIVPLNSMHRVLVIASDGVWDVLSSQEVGDIALAQSTCELACQAILQEALLKWGERGSADNIGIVVAFL